MTDYYKLLEISPSASAEEIQVAIKKIRRVWNARSSNPNAGIRAEAEQNIRDIAQAERVLLDEGERAKYNATLNQQFVSAPVETAPQQSYNDNSWIDDVDYYRNRGDYISIVNLMQRVLSSQPQNYLAWYAIGDAYYKQENYGEAEKSLLQSIRLETNDLAYGVLGLVYAECDEYEEAYRCFSKAAELDPDEANYKFNCAETLRLMNKLNEAMVIVEKAYKQDPSIPTAKPIYFSCLRDLIYNAVSYNRSSGRHIIINQRQLEFVKTYLPKLSKMVVEGRREHTKVEEELRQMVIAAETTHGLFSKPGYVKNYEMSNADTRKTGLQ